MIAASRTLRSGKGLGAGAERETRRRGVAQKGKAQRGGPYRLKQAQMILSVASTRARALTPAGADRRRRYMPYHYTRGTVPLATYLDTRAVARAHEWGRLYRCSLRREHIHKKKHTHQHTKKMKKRKKRLTPPTKVAKVSKTPRKLSVATPFSTHRRKHGEIHQPYRAQPVVQEPP